MEVCETHLDTSELYHSALDTLMDSLHINSTPSGPSRYNNSSRRHINSVDEDKFISFGSTMKQYCNRDKLENSKQENDAASKTSVQDIGETPKRSVTMTRKQKLFQSTDSTKDFKSLKSKELSPQNLLLKKAIARYESLQGRQDRMVLSKKPIRTSLRL